MEYVAFLVEHTGGSSKLVMVHKEVYEQEGSDPKMFVVGDPTIKNLGEVTILDGGAADHLPDVLEEQSF